MSIQIKSVTIDLTPALRDYAEKRLISLEKYAGGALMITADIGKTTMHHHHGDVFVATVTVVTALGKEYHAKSEKPDLYEAIDDVRNELMEMITSGKKKTDSLWKKGARRVKRLIKGLR